MMDIVPMDRRPVRAIGGGGHSASAAGDGQADGADPSILDDPDALLGFGDDDGWPPHFGAARLGIP
jgi:hypothetical protein